MRTVIFISAASLLALTACGDSAGPSLPEVSPSTLSVTFTGSTDGEATGGPAHRSISEGFPSDGPVSSCRVTASWTMCTDHGFSSYRLYRSEVPGISSDPGCALLQGEFDSYLTTTFTDGSVTWETEYFYALETTDKNGNGVWSNEAAITTPAVEAPSPSELFLAELTWEYVELAWSVCPETNFHTYRLYRSDLPGIQADSSMAQLLCTNDWKLDTAFVDFSAAFSSTYYYALLTTNTEDLSTWSNEIEVLTCDPVPITVVATLNALPEPWDAASIQSGEYVYVTSRSDDAVCVIRTSDNVMTATVPVGASPYGICPLPSGDYVYTANWGSDDVSVIRTSDNTVVETVSAGRRPVAICALPSGEFVYVACRDDNSVTVIRTSDNTVVDNVPAGTSPHGICSLPSGDYVYVTNFSSGDMSVIRTSDNTVIDTVSLFAQPAAVCALPSGEYVYVSSYGDDAVAVVRTSDNSIVKTVEVGNGPWGVCAHTSGECVYVVNSIDDTMSLVRTSDNKVVALIEVGSSPSGICLTPSGSSLYVINYGDGTVSVLQ